MQHGGPYPASTNPLFTSVGAKAILRFRRPLPIKISHKTISRLYCEKELRNLTTLESTARVKSSLKETKSLTFAAYEGSRHWE
jgi:hypothetical protein